MGLTLGASDTIDELARVIDQNPDTCLIYELDEKVIAGVIGGFDGRRGFVHHLAVDPTYQRRGYGSELMWELERRFRDKKLVKFSLWIESNNTKAIDFYQKLNYDLRDLITMSKTLRND